jgi:hypothetical protein
MTVTLDDLKNIKPLNKDELFKLMIEGKYVFRFCTEVPNKFYTTYNYPSDKYSGTYTKYIYRIDNLPHLPPGDYTKDYRINFPTTTLEGATNGEWTIIEKNNCALLKKTVKIDIDNNEEFLTDVDPEQFAGPYWVINDTSGVCTEVLWYCPKFQKLQSTTIYYK